ncbi:uncharacterized protein TNCV_4919391 [Trichonephila clavipes]|nr:uncharacterized protein TNCV_4919391 [Trichonephila clavipes]
MKERDLVMGLVCRTREIPRKPLGDESKSHKSNKGTAGLEDLRLKRKVGSNETAERNDIKRSKICMKRSFQGYEHGDQKRQTPVLPQGLKRTISSSVACRIHKIGENTLILHRDYSQLQVHHINKKMKQLSPPKEESRRGARVQSDWALKTRTTRSKKYSAAEERPVRSGETTTVRPCPYYLRSRLKEPEEVPEEHWDRQSTAEQRQEKESQQGNVR